MLLARRWQQVTESDPMNPYQRRMIRPAYGNVGEGAHGTFFFNPLPTDNFQIMKGRSQQITVTGGQISGPATDAAMTTVKVLGIVGGLALGVWYGIRHF